MAPGNAASRSSWPARVLALGVCCALLAGCQTWNWQGANFNDKDDLSAYNEKLRPGSAHEAEEKPRSFWKGVHEFFHPSGELDGVSTKANQIERNLGYR